MALLGRSYTIPIIRKGDPTSAPVNNGGPLATVFVSKPAPKPVPAATVITRIGDPNAAPVISFATPAPFVVQPIQPRPFKGQVLLGASAADIGFVGPLVATPVPPKPARNTSVVVLPFGPFLGEPPPGPFIITRQPPAPRPVILTWQQLQDGAAGIVSGPGATVLLVTRPRAPLPVPATFMSLPAAAPVIAAAATPTPVIIQAPRLVRRLLRLITRRTFTAPAGPAQPPDFDTPALLTLEPHANAVTLGAHGTGLALDVAHASKTTLEAHASAVALDAHQSRIDLEP